MSVRERVPASGADSVDLSATLELLASLTQYAEAGAVQPHTLAQAAQHALEQHGDHIEVLIAVAKLHLATEQRDAATRVLGRAARLFPGDARIEQLRVEGGLDTIRPGPVSVLGATPMSGSRDADEATYDTSVRRRAGFLDDDPDSSRTPVSLRSRPDPSAQRARPVTVDVREPSFQAPQPVPARDVRQSVPGDVRQSVPGDVRQSVPGDVRRPSPRPAEPLPRPTVKMARVAATPERQRWGKAEGREPLSSRSPFDSRPDLDSRPDREPASESPRSIRSVQRNVSFREPAQTPTPPLARPGRDPRSGRAATGNLKLLDPTDDRKQLDRYELIGEIASGGMASVFLARLAGVAGFQRFYAIKRLHPHLADEQEFIDMFLDEARLAAGIHHPNVVPILEVGTSDAGYYLVMDYIEGDTLSGVISRAGAYGPLPRPVALRIVLDALHGLHAAHELTDPDGNLVDLVHRDCSPQNILVGVDGSSRITDFGVARASSRLTNTATTTVKGKLAYLSPEQATGRALDRRSDLFGMGVILWEVLAGRRLFRAESEGATLSRILVEPMPSLADHAPDIPSNVADVVMIALSRNPADRFTTATDMADALEHAVREVETPDLFIASPRDVSGYMRELFGPDISARRDTIRAWVVASGEAADGPRSQGSHRGGAGSPAPSNVRGRLPSVPDSGPESDAPVDSEVPSTKKEASILRAEEEASAASMKAAPAPAVKADATPAKAPAPAGKADATPAKAPAPAGKADLGAPPDPPAASQRTAAPTDPTAPDAPSPLRDQRLQATGKRPPVALIALTLLLVLAALAVLAARSLG